MTAQLRSWANLLGGEVSGTEVRCPGPGHSAKDRSLSVKIGKDGEPIVHSFSGDDWQTCRDYVRQRLGMEPFKPNGGRKTVATYEFRDPATGDVRYRKERVESADGSKSFFFKPAGRNGSDPLLYGGERLADVGEGQPVFVVEGEKKVDRLRELGAVAVSGDSGWSSKWLPAHADLLRGLPVILWPDSDEPGEKYAAIAANRLRDSAASLRVVRPFGPPNGAKGRDVCDWSGNAEDLAALTANAEVYVAEPKDEAQRAFNREYIAARRAFDKEWDQVAAELEAGNWPRESRKPNGETKGEAPSPIVAKPYIYRDPRSIPPRQFLHAGHYIRGFLSATFAPGGLGKTSLQLVEAIGMAVGRDLLKGITSPRKLKVWYWNLEDPRDETDRRIAAIILHYDINPSTIEEQLFINSDEPLVIATRIKDATVVAEPVVNGLVSEIDRLQIDALIIDPFVSLHKVPENDNNAIDTVAKTWSGIGRARNCAVELAHHIRKPASGSTAEITVDDGRGAGSLKDAGRSVRVLNTMSKEEAENVGIKPDQRKRYFRIEAGKTNMKPPAENIEWRKLVSVPLNNAAREEEGDWVGVVTKWKMPGALEGVTASDLLRVQKRVSEDKWREDSRATAWVGKAVAETLNLNVREPAVKKRILGMIKIWLETGALRIVEADDDRRHKREFIEVGEWAT